METKTAKHTPGPWKLSDTYYCPQSQTQARQITTTDDDPTQIIKFDSFRTSPANAHLIAAAPEMLEALSDILSWPALANCPDSKVAAGLAAIALAQGGTP